MNSFFKIWGRNRSLMVQNTSIKKKKKILRFCSKKFNVDWETQERNSLWPSKKYCANKNTTSLDMVSAVVCSFDCLSIANTREACLIPPLARKQSENLQNLPCLHGWASLPTGKFFSECHSRGREKKSRTARFGEVQSRLFGDFARRIRSKLASALSKGLSRVQTDFVCEH